MRYLQILFLCTGVCIAGLSHSAVAEPGPLYILTLDGVIDPVLAEYVKSGLREAQTKDAAAVVLELNTPGGLLDSTRLIIQEMLNTPLATIVYVTPRGARAASAGVFITMASDVAAMTPLTHIGAAHPVSIGGGFPGMPQKGDEPPEQQGAKKSTEPAGKPSDGGVMEEKIVSDASAYIESLAKDKKRNWEWAVKAVRESVSITAEEALTRNVIEHVADDLDALCAALEGTEITKAKRSVKLAVKTAPRVRYELSFFKRFLHTITNPNVAYMLLMLGFYGLIYEFSSPGVGIGGIFGGISLLLAFYALQVLPVNFVGLALIILGLVLMVLDLKIASGGLLTAGGIAAFVLGSFFLIDLSEFYVRISTGLIVGLGLSTGLFFGFALKKVLEGQRRKPSTGKEGLIGEQGTVRQRLAPEGIVFVHGEYWSASSDTVCEQGESVKVVGVQGSRLVVTKAVTAEQAHPQ